MKKHILQVLKEAEEAGKAGQPNPPENLADAPTPELKALLAKRYEKGRTAVAAVKK